MPEFLLQGRPPVRCFGIAVVLSNNSLISIALVATLAGSAFIAILQRQKHPEFTQRKNSFQNFDYVITHHRNIPPRPAAETVSLLQEKTKSTSYMYRYRKSPVMLRRPTNFIFIHVVSR